MFCWNPYFVNYISKFIICLFFRIIIFIATICRLSKNKKKIKSEGSKSLGNIACKFCFRYYIIFSR